MRGPNFRIVTKADATKSARYGPYDAQLRTSVAFTAVLADTSGANLTYTMYGSNQPCPAGAENTSWQPDADSLFVLEEAGPITQTVTADGTSTLAVGTDGLSGCRWVLFDFAVNTPGGGTYSLDYAGRGYA